MFGEGHHGLGADGYQTRSRRECIASQCRLLTDRLRWLKYNEEAAEVATGGREGDGVRPKGDEAEH